MTSENIDKTCECCNDSTAVQQSGRFTRRRIIQTGIVAGTAGLASSLVLPELVLADHYGCYYPDGTGNVWVPDSGKLPDPKKLDVVTIIRKGYCGYKNGTFPGGKVDLGNPHPDARFGRLNLWDGYWTQKFQGPLGVTNLMVEPRSGKVFRLYGDWLAKYMERGGPSVFGAPANDAHQAGTAVEQWFVGGSAARCAFFRTRDGAPVYTVQGAIFDLYASERGTAGRLGAPVTNEYAIAGGAQSDFVNGSIIYQNGAARVQMKGQPSDATGAKPGDGRGVPAHVAEQFRITYNDYRLSTGKSLGSPVSGEKGYVHLWENVWTQSFNGPDGRTNLMYQEAHGRVYRLYGAWLQTFDERGGAKVFGAPSDLPHRAGSGDEQYFRGGSVGQAGFFRKVTNAPVHVVQGSILDRYRQERGTIGRLGAPRTSELPLISGAARADFEKGSIVWFGDGRTEVFISGQRRQVVVFLSGITSRYSSNTFESDDSKQVRTKLRAAGINFYTLLFSYAGGRMSDRGEWQPGHYSCEETFNKLESSAEHLSSLMRSYSEHYPGVDFIVMGHSLGGVIAWKMITKGVDVRANNSRTAAIGLDLAANNSRIAAIVTMGSPLNRVSQTPAIKWERICSKAGGTWRDATVVADALESLPRREENESMSRHLMDSEGIQILTYVSTSDLVYILSGESTMMKVKSGGCVSNLGDHGHYIHSEALWFHLTTYLKNEFMGLNVPMPPCTLSG